jgi:hypothetical protein
MAPYILSLPFTLLWLLLQSPLILADAPVSFHQASGYATQRVCAFGCFEDFHDPGYPIARELSCPNDCFCRPDLQPTATSYISSCLNGKCGRNSLDISRGLAIYTDYCTAAGYTTEAPPITPAPTGAFTVTRERTVTVTVTASLDSSHSSHSLPHLFPFLSMFVSLCCFLGLLGMLGFSLMQLMTPLHH